VLTQRFRYGNGIGGFFEYLANGLHGFLLVDVFREFG
jgi:hypothetical protein